MRGHAAVRTAGVILFAAAFGYVEAAVVVYLRAIAYPEGFAFPLKPMAPELVLTEIGREAATLLMLLGVAFATERRGYRRWAVFALAFGVWDLVYYLVLKAILDWPENWLTWDVLFLIPAVWTGPVLAPVLVSAALVGAALWLLAIPEAQPSPLRLRDWVAESAAGFVIVVTFLWNAPDAAAGEVPDHFPWPLFLAAYAGGLTIFVRACLRGRSPSSRSGTG